MALWRPGDDLVPVATRVLRTLLLAGVLSTLPAGFAHAQGDGSHSNNADLLRGSFSPFCEPAMLCHQGRVQPEVAAVPAPATPAPAAPAPSASPVIASTVYAPEVAAVPAPISPVSTQPSLGYPAAQWSPWRASYGVSLRGAYVHFGGTNRYEALVVPNMALSYNGQGRTARIAGEATLVQPHNGEARLGGAKLNTSYSQALSSTTGLRLDGSITLDQDDPNGLDVRPAGVMTGPLEFRAAANAGVTQQFGRFDLTTGLGVSRSQKGETRLANGSVIDNSGSDRTSVSADIRLGYRITPIFGVFVSGDGSREEFDHISTDIGARRSGWNYAIRGGINANWHDQTTVEASIGSGWRLYDDATLPETQSLLYGFALGYNPDPTLRLRAALDTTIEPGSVGAVSSVDHTLSLEASYRVNQLLGLRGTASASLSEAQGTGVTTRRYGARLGADIAIGPHTDMTLDYGYGWREDPAAVPQVLTEHRFSAGVTLQY